VGTQAGSYTLTATEGNNGHFVSASFNITPGAPATVEFTGQPTDTLVDRVITPAVEVTVTDAFGNTVPAGTSVTMGISATANPGPGTLSGTLSQSTDAAGVAAFGDLKINKSSSDYKLEAAVSPTVKATSDFFEITSDTANCNGTDPCNVSAQSGDSSITVDSDGFGTLSVTFESVPPDCPALPPGQAYQVQVAWTINPPTDATAVTTTFDDTIFPPYAAQYPVCKTVESGGTLTTEVVPFCSDNGGALPCISEQEIQFHGSQPATLHTVVKMTAVDPKSYH
jgi:hypothetical protein